MKINANFSAKLWPKMFFKDQTLENGVELFWTLSWPEVMFSTDLAVRYGSCFVVSPTTPFWSHSLHEVLYTEYRPDRDFLKCTLQWQYLQLLPNFIYIEKIEVYYAIIFQFLTKSSCFLLLFCTYFLNQTLPSFLGRTTELFLLSILVSMAIFYPLSHIWSSHQFISVSMWHFNKRLKKQVDKKLIYLKMFINVNAINIFYSPD